MRAIAAAGLSFALMAAGGAQAAPRSEFAPIQKIPEIRTPGLPKPEPFRPYKAPKPYSIYGDDPTSLAPRARPYESPYFKPYRGPSIYGDDPTSLSPSRSRPKGPGFDHSDGLDPSGGTFGPSGGTLGKRRGGTF
jgi:hypothetical protein